MLRAAPLRIRLMMAVVCVHVGRVIFSVGHPGVSALQATAPTLLRSALVLLMSLIIGLSVTLKCEHLMGARRDRHNRSHSNAGSTDIFLKTLFIGSCKMAKIMQPAHL